jgi:hypothetical protein
MAESVLESSDINVAKEWESLDVMSSLLNPRQLAHDEGVNADICTFKHSIQGKGIVVDGFS